MINPFKFIFNRNRIKVNVLLIHDGLYSAMAFDGMRGVYNCYGTTPKKAKEMALQKLKKCVENSQTTI